MSGSYRRVAVAATLALWMLLIPWSIAAQTRAVGVGQGSYPDIAVDAAGDIHLVYARAGFLYYNKYRAAERRWGSESAVGLPVGNISRSDPEIAIDSRGRPHVFVGYSYAYLADDGWKAVKTHTSRDSALAIDSQDTVYLCRRGGYAGGYAGIEKLSAGASSFTPTSDPDIGGGFPKYVGSDHVYGHLAVGKDDSLHYVYRHGTPLETSYRVSYDGGATWFGGGIAKDSYEEPFVAALPDGTVYVVTGNGSLYRRDGAPDSWTPIGRILTLGARFLPVLTVDKTGSIFSAAFGGRWNVRRADGSFLGTRKIPPRNGETIGYGDLAAAPGGAVYLAYEEGTEIYFGDDETASGTNAIFIAELKADGGVSYLE
jgi:hypothetical protein